ncbi:Pr6Pr family membrane protein [Microbacterium sp. LRZ72]|uniref:Pr6Pr family membrane protein n=1 Tax=Microbacterium sp. LRZ72 TaxID=2942481 RepID=UPI0029BA34AF|nr:Pr6Pr family membrane protein [Microbacterium sp. LRZ72]MDX2376274.1 Pr6Pr family membrane protein [Microbacterium sp. LRZ72]
MLPSSGWAWTWSFVRIATAILGVAAIIAQLVRSVSNANAAGSGPASDVATVVTNFLSFFTIQSNLAAALTLAFGAIWFWTRGRRTQDAEPRAFAIVLVCVTTYMLITGIVYNLLLRTIALAPGETVPWSNECLHVVIPTIMLLDLLFAPRRRRLPWRIVPVVLAFPAAWIVYTMVRAPFITNPGSGASYWYPYPFLDPYGDGGWASVIAYIVAIALATLAIGYIAVGVGHWRAHRAPVPGNATGDAEGGAAGPSPRSRRSGAAR